mmetsp:Transcript_17127/g.23538  ORF Transcript_17127/g.23538 Transcript_17127/m.23538 type:complete len:367 (-) Transcript_17127:166-1266(-)
MGATKFFVSSLALLILSQQVVAFAPPLSPIAKPGTCDKKVYCRSWQSGTFPLCDGTHMKHNGATSDNVGPLTVSFAKAENEDEEETTESDTAADDKKIAGRKKRVIVGYQATTVAYLIATFTVIRKLGLTTLLAYFLSGYMMTAAVAYILVGAAENDRLGSNTYKRLNLAVSTYGLFGLINQYLMPPNRNPAVLIASYLAFINSIKGYAYGALGWDKKNEDTTLVKDFVGLTTDMIKGIFSIPKNMKSFGYLGATGMLGTMKVLKLVEAVKMIKEGADGFAIATRLTRFARLALMAMVFYVLKDAADRDRLEGSTFIELNFLSAIYMAIMSVYVGFNTRLGGFAAFFSAFSAVNGLASIQKNKSKA